MQSTSNLSDCRIFYMFCQFWLFSNPCIYFILFHLLLFIWLVASLRSTLSPLGLTPFCTGHDKPSELIYRTNALGFDLNNGKTLTSNSIQ